MEQKMNEFLSDLIVFYHKLQCYHWYVKGENFFMVHTTLEMLYEEVKLQVDEVAEAALMIGFAPKATLADFAKLASIKEAKNEFVTPKTVFKDILADYQHLLESVEMLKTEAEENEINLISVKADDLIECYSKRIWMLSQSQM